MLIIFIRRDCNVELKSIFRNKSGFWCSYKQRSNVFRQFWWWPWHYWSRKHRNGVGEFEILELVSINFQLSPYLPDMSKTYIFRLKSQKPSQHSWVHLCLILKANSSTTITLVNQHLWNPDDCGKEGGQKSPSRQRGNDHTNR